MVRKKECKGVIVSFLSFISRPKPPDGCANNSSYSVGKPP